MTPELKLAAAIREVTATVQPLIKSGQWSAAIDAHDLIEALLTIAERLHSDGG